MDAQPAGEPFSRVRKKSCAIHTRQAMRLCPPHLPEMFFRAPQRARLFYSRRARRLRSERLCPRRPSRAARSGRGAFFAAGAPGMSPIAANIMGTWGWRRCARGCWWRYACWWRWRWYVRQWRERRRWRAAARQQDAARGLCSHVRPAEVASAVGRRARCAHGQPPRQIAAPTRARGRTLSRCRIGATRRKYRPTSARPRGRLFAPRAAALAGASCPNVCAFTRLRRRPSAPRA